MPENRDLVPNQFGDSTLTYEEALSACGPAAAVALARKYGNEIPLRAALDAAKQVGWTAAGGMNGVQNQARLLERLGVKARLDARPTPEAIVRDVQSGNPVTISTAKHYYVADQYDPQTGRVHVGNSGTARRGGSRWMTIAQIEGLDGGINGALFVDNPQTPTPSPAATGGQAMEPAQPLGGQDVLALLTQKKGQPFPPRALDPKMDASEEDILEGRSEGGKVPNREPVYRYLWPDGTYLDMKASSSSPNQVVGGTALSDMKPDATAKPGEPFQRFTGPDGKEYVFDQRTGEVKPAQGVGPKPPGTADKPEVISGAGRTEQFIPVKQPDGSIRWIQNQNFNTRTSLEDDQLGVSRGNLAVAQQNAGSSALSAAASWLNAQIGQGRLDFDKAKYAIDNILAAPPRVVVDGEAYVGGLEPGGFLQQMAKRWNLPGVPTFKFADVDIASAIGRPDINQHVRGGNYRDSLDAMGQQNAAPAAVPPPAPVPPAPVAPVTPAAQAPQQMTAMKVAPSPVAPPKGFVPGGQPPPPAMPTFGQQQFLDANAAPQAAPLAAEGDPMRPSGGTPTFGSGQEASGPAFGDPLLGQIIAFAQAQGADYRQALDVARQALGMAA